MKLKSFCTANSHQTEETTHRMGENLPSDKGFICSIYRWLKKLNSLKINDPMNKWTNEWNGNFSKDEVHMLPSKKKKKHT
jgi:hypothetical protein